MGLGYYFRDVHLYFPISPSSPLKTPVRHKPNRRDHEPSILEGNSGPCGCLIFWWVEVKRTQGDLGPQVAWGHPAGKAFPEDMTFENGNGDNPAGLPGQVEPWLQASRGPVSSWPQWSLSPPQAVHLQTAARTLSSCSITTNTNKQSPAMPSLSGILIPSGSLEARLSLLLAFQPDSSFLTQQPWAIITHTYYNPLPSPGSHYHRDLRKWQGQAQ